MKDGDVEKEVRSLIASIVELPEETIAPEALFVDDLGMDSMMALEILAALEKNIRFRSRSRIWPNLSICGRRLN